RRGGTQQVAGPDEPRREEPQGPRGGRESAGADQADYGRPQERSRRREGEPGDGKIPLPDARPVGAGAADAGQGQRRGTQGAGEERPGPAQEQQAPGRGWRGLVDPVGGRERPGEVKPPGAGGLLVREGPPGPDRRDEGQARQTRRVVLRPGGP